jgi:hypothetical protein
VQPSGCRSLACHRRHISSAQIVMPPVGDLMSNVLPAPTASAVAAREGRVNWFGERPRPRDGERTLAQRLTVSDTPSARAHRSCATVLLRGVDDAAPSKSHAHEVGVGVDVSVNCM